MVGWSTVTTPTHETPNHETPNHDETTEEMLARQETGDRGTGDPSTEGGQVAGRPLIVGLCVAITATAFESISVATAMPVAAQRLGHVSWYAWAFSAFQVGSLLATIVSGRFCDRVGPIRPLIVGMAIFAAGLVVAGTSVTMEQLIGGRFVQGLGAGTMSVALYVLVARVFDERHRPRVFSWISSAWLLPSFIGPPIAAFLTQRLSWHWVFFAVLPLVAAAAAITGPILVRIRRAGLDTGHAEADAVPVWAAVLAGAGVPALQLAGQRLDAISIPLAIGGAALLGVGLPRLLPRGFFRARGWGGISAAIAGRGLIAGSWFAAESFVPLMLVQTRRIPLVLAGLVLTLGAIGWASGSYLQARPRWLAVRHRILAVGTVLIAAGLVLMTLVALLPGLWVGLVVFAWVGGGLGMGLAYSSTTLAVMALSEPQEQGRNSSSLQLAESLGTAALTAAAGSIFAALDGGVAAPASFAAPIGTMAGLALLSILVVSRVGAIRAAGEADR